MKYYKVIYANNIVGVATTNGLRKYQKKHNLFLMCEESDAQYIECNGEIYHASWMIPETIDYSEYPKADVIEIGEAEYNTLFTAIETGEEIKVEQNVEVVDDSIVDPVEELTLEYVISKKIEEMSYYCNKSIVNGFDCILSDGKVYHFSLDTADQLNLITLSTMIASGETAIPYHADGELCRFYTVDDISTILSSATNFKTYQVSYYNSLKSYIESLTDIESVSNVVYGMNVPIEYQSDVLRVLNMQMEM